MKKSNFFAFAALSVLALASCSKEDDPIIDDPKMEGEQVIVLDMQDTDVLSTKSRPLYSTSSKGAEFVTDVQLLVLGTDTNSVNAAGEITGPLKLARIFHIPNWNNSSSQYEYGRKYTFKIPAAQKLSKDSVYTIVGVGQDESDRIPEPFEFVLGDAAATNLAGMAMPATDLTSAFNTTPGSGFLKTDTVRYSLVGEKKYNRNKSCVSEVFSGTSDPVLVGINGGIQATVLLKRQVAGVIGYFNRIPAWILRGDQLVSTAGIRLVSSARNAAVDLAIQLAKQNDDKTGVTPEHIMNGFTKDADKGDDGIKANAKFMSGKEAYTIYQIDLTEWFGEGGNQGVQFWDPKALTAPTDNGYPLLSSKVWRNALKGTNDTPVVADSAVLAGEFVVPFARVEGIQDNTFELQLIDSIGEPTKAWKVKLDAASLDPKLGDDNYVYNIYRNHLYQIGKRGSGDDPDKPGTDPDKPQPLDKDQELTIKINDQWEFIHDMEIE
ncbi:hypothetical protein [Parabacteroides johnsonii]|uniref:hypothetical protein n=1 Tax=Parabacteroides johnsonii TaxID=387661 RepID=UPI0011DCEB58|nr:hypothetical protein [Parabacteroides johnsonii]